MVGFFMRLPLVADADVRLHGLGSAAFVCIGSPPCRHGTFRTHATFGVFRQPWLHCLHALERMLVIVVVHEDLSLVSRLHTPAISSNNMPNAAASALFLKLKLFDTLWRSDSSGCIASIIPLSPSMTLEVAPPMAGWSCGW